MAELAHMMRDLSQKNCHTFNRKGGHLVFDLQTKRPEFVQYASAYKAHDNRFVHINMDTLVSSKNHKA